MDAYKEVLVEQHREKKHREKRVRVTIGRITGGL